MKKRIVAGVAVFLLLSTALAACQNTQSSAPPPNNGTKSVNTEITYDEFFKSTPRDKDS